MILLGNTYPLSLIRRPVSISPASLEELRQCAQEEGFLSFWGHDNTRAIAKAILGFDPAPPFPRPAITLSRENLPTFDGQVFSEVWVLSPDYATPFRPGVGEEVHANKILRWQVLHIRFSEAVSS